MTDHSYAVEVRWTGDRGSGTSAYRAYDRDHEVVVAGKPVILGSSDPDFRGDAARHNPEELLVAALSQCHLLWYLHLCAEAGVVVTAYADHATGTMRTGPDGGGAFTEVTLRPQVTVADAAMSTAAGDLHAAAHARCFIANSVSFPVRHQPTIRTGP